MHKVVAGARDFRPHSIFSEMIKEIESLGFYFISSIYYLDNFLVVKGINNAIVINKALEEEINYAVGLARNIVNLDIGQTVIFKDKAVVAVEALEGTDNTIKRAWRICGKNSLIIKLAKKNQDLRFDVPVVGLKTIKLLAKIKAKALVLETKKAVFLDKEKMFKLSVKFGIPIIGV